MLQYEYVRSALKTGLTLEKKLGVNPFKFGMIGSTDSHTSLAPPSKRTIFSGSTPAWNPSHTAGSMSSSPLLWIRI